jgi:hypothetical protein
MPQIDAECRPCGVRWLPCRAGTTQANAQRKCAAGRVTASRPFRSVRDIRAAGPA